MHLDTTLEEDVLDAQSQSRSRTPSYPQSPVLSVSPPHDVKVRQISQGVEDMKWQQGPQSQQEARSDSQLSITPSQDANEMQASIKATQAVSESQSAQAPPCSLSSVDDTTEDVEEAQDTASSLPHTRRTSESDGGETEKGLKRKLADRATSLGPESGPSTVTPSAETAKRPRDDADKDDNPRVSKRPSPPPEQNDESPPAPAPPPETPAPKLVRILLYGVVSCPVKSIRRMGSCRMLLQRPRLLLSKDRTSSPALNPTIENRLRPRLQNLFHCLLIPHHPSIPPLHLRLTNHRSQRLRHLILLHNKRHRAPPPSGRALKPLLDRLPHLQLLLHFRLQGPNLRWGTMVEKVAYLDGANLRPDGQWA